MPVYIYVMEGIHGDRRLHIHQLISARDMDWAELVECWPYGEIIPTQIKDFEHRNNLGQYLTKEPAKLGRLRNDQNLFMASHNCQKPSVKSWSMGDDCTYTIPEGYEINASEHIKNKFGSFTYYVLKRKKRSLPSCNAQ